jgi:3-phenylpropionate/trans-cinnamate dioxygenase ferredoxin subunit
VGRVEDFSPGQVKIVRVLGQRLGVVNCEGTLYCFEDRCTHDDGPLGDGPLRGCEIECPRHGARFDVRDGRVTKAPAMIPLEVFDVELVDGQVQIIMPD